MRNRLPFLSGLALATLGVSGLAGGGLLWNFQGRTLGLGSTVTALVLLGISFVLLRPEPRLSPVEVPEASQPLKFKAPQASFLGLMLAILGTFGMAGSGLVETTEVVSESAAPAQTTAEAIAELLAAEQQQRPELTLVNFAPLNLLPGQSVPTKSRRAGSSLGRYRSMANDLFKS